MPPTKQKLQGLLFMHFAEQNCIREFVNLIKHLGIRVIEKSVKQEEELHEKYPC